MYTGPVTQGGSGGGPAAPSVTTTARAGLRSETIDADYTHVVSDLKRIGILAGGLIAVLVALSFFIK